MLGFELPSFSTLNFPAYDAGRFLDNAAMPARNIANQITQPSRDTDMDWGSIFGGAAQGAGGGLALGGPVGAGIGAGIGAITGLFGKPSSSGGGGLLDAFGAGLKSIGIPLGGSSSTPQNIVQTQSVSQGTSVNVSNVLGGQPFGGVQADGSFDIFQAISDVYKIKDAQGAVTDTPVVTGGGSLNLLQPATKNYLPLVLGVAALAALLLLTKKKGK